MSRKCQWCSAPFESAHPTKMFCSNQHKQDHANWMTARGKALMPIALAWRTQRGRKGVGADAMKEMVLFLDKCAAEYAALGAQPVANHYRSTRADGTGTSTWRDYERKRPSIDRRDTEA